MMAKKINLFLSYVSYLVLKAKAAGHKRGARQSTLVLCIIEPASTVGYVVYLLCKTIKILTVCFVLIVNYLNPHNDGASADTDAVY